jgi:hypothetical protein
MQNANLFLGSGPENSKRIVRRRSRPPHPGGRRPESPRWPARLTAVWPAPRPAGPRPSARAASARTGSTARPGLGRPAPRGGGSGRSRETAPCAHQASRWLAADERQRWKGAHSYSEGAEEVCAPLPPAASCVCPCPLSAASCCPPSPCLLSPSPFLLLLHVSCCFHLLVCLEEAREGELGLGRIVALPYRSHTLNQIH